MKACPQCDESLPTSAATCPNCGHAIGASDDSRSDRADHFPVGPTDFGFPTTDVSETADKSTEEGMQDDSAPEKFSHSIEEEENDLSEPMSTESSPGGSSADDPRTRHIEYARTGLAVTSGLSFVAFLRVETIAAGLPGHFLVVALTVVSGLSAAALLVVPLTSMEPGYKDVIYVSSGLLVGCLATTTMFLARGAVQYGPIFALVAGSLALTAGLLPTLALHLDADGPDSH